MGSGENEVYPTSVQGPSGPSPTNGWAEADRPFVSVIVIASRHREFVGDALDSVRAQTLAPKDFELVVVRDYDDPELERRVTELGGRTVPIPSGDIGPAIEAGLVTSRGHVLVFLDDDDRYRPGRLAAVTRAFRDDPNLGFFRNGFAVIDATGQGMAHHPFRAAQRESGRRFGVITLAAVEREDGMRNLPPLGLDFNSSCIAVRRDVLARFVGGRDLTGFRVLDALLFVAALAAPVAIRFDPSVLTEYRIHGRNASRNPQERSDPLAGRADFARRVAASYVRLIEMARASGVALAITEAEGLATVQQAYLALRDLSSTRAEFVRLRRALAAQRRSYVVRSERSLPSALRLFSLSPTLGRWLYSRRVRAGSG